MKLLILSEHDVHALMPVAECIPVMEEALRALARGEVTQPLRTVVRPENADGFLGLMPAYRGGPHPAYGLKEICLFPGNPARGLDTHLGAVLLHSGETGELQAVVNASAVTAIRTAAVSGVATKLLARTEPGDLAVLGAGVQARTHIEAMLAVRPVRRIRITSRSPERARACAGEMRSRLPIGPEIDVVDSVEEALNGASIVVTATSAKEPIVRREWLAPGAHINAVGSSVAHTRELDSATVAAASLFVDRRESTTHESGDYLFALREGAIGEDHIRGELGELLLGTVAGRRSPDELTLFKSLGLGIEDLASASYLFEKAQKTGAGTWVEW
jgi:ornithine cyclodeaminase/alanine dehydrogenase-like protein (mu-crystallin family)